MGQTVLSEADLEDRSVCAVLAAQVSALRDRLEALAAVETLWQATDMLSNLAGLVGELSRRGPLPEPRLEAQCLEAIASATALSASLDELAFLQAQRLDYARQMGDGLATALEQLASADQRGRTRLSLTDLKALYVCEAQRIAHQLALRGLDSHQGQGESLPEGLDPGGAAQ